MAETNYCLTDEVLAWLSVTDTGLTDVLNTAIPAASRWVDGHCHRRFWRDDAVSARYFDVSSDGTVYTDDIATSTGLVVATDTGGDGTYVTPWAATDFQLLPLNAANLVPAHPYWKLRSTGSTYGFSLGSRTGYVSVTALWGWPAVPDDVKQATIMQAARIAHRRNSPQGVAGFNDFGVVRVATDQDIADLLQPYVLVTVA